MDGAADLQDAVAILFDLARRGVLSLKQEQGADVRVQLHRATEDPSLARYERVLLVALFGRGVSEGEVLLSQTRIRFASAVCPFSNSACTRLSSAKACSSPIPCWSGVALPDSAGLGWASARCWRSWRRCWWAALCRAAVPGVVVVVLGVLVVWLSRKVPRRTARGALEAARWRAFRTHLLQESHTLEDAHLAYAVALGADREYLRQLEVRSGPVPWCMPANASPIIFFPGGWYGGGVGCGVGGGGGGGMPVPPTVGAPGAGGPQGWSDALADLLNAAAGALSQGGGSGPWSGGGWGGGGGGGGGSGGLS